MTTISYEEFERVNFPSATIVKVEEFLLAKKPVFKVGEIFGPQVGVLQPSAHVTVHYTSQALIGRQILGCVNLEEKNIAGFTSQFLLVRFADESGAISLITVDPKVPNAQKMH